ncbi:type II secretion system protein [bacterium]|nr:type II secretion system protein [bacterium]
MSKTCHSETPQAGSESVRKCAFTLAEVLITLGIIGVVAALTIPTLMQSYQNKQYVSGFQKAWGLLSNAVEMSEAHNGFSSTWDEPVAVGSVDENYMQKYWLPYFKIIKDCGIAQGQGCMPAEVHYLNGDVGPHNDDLSHYKILISDGMSLDFAQNIGSNPYRQHIVVDINGSKGPNIYGRDIFWFEFFANEDKKIFPFGFHNDFNIEENCSLSGSGQVCGAYLVKNGYKMDY